MRCLSCGFCFIWAKGSAFNFFLPFFGGGVVFFAEFIEQGFDVAGGLGEVWIVVYLGLDFVAEDFIACDVVAAAVLIDLGVHGGGRLVRISNVGKWAVVKTNELLCFEGEHGVGLAVIVAEFDFVNAGGEGFDDGADLTGQKVVVGQGFSEGDYI